MQTVILSNRDQLESHYRHYLESDPQIASVLSTPASREELTGAFMAWLGELMNFNAMSADAFCDRQMRIGSMMARVGYPPHAISRGLHKLTLWFIDRLAATPLPADQLVPSMRFVVMLVGTCMEIREVSYHSNVASLSRLGEAYRLHALSLNLGLERERQRAALLEWSHRLLLSVHQDAWAESLNRIDRSEFGLWLTHKAPLLFDRDTELERIVASARRIDGELLPALSAAAASGRPATLEGIQRIEAELATIRFALNNLFDTHLELEKGRDQLTHLLNRRFLPPVLMREIALQRSGVGKGLCALLLDIDHFKVVNDTHGHDGGDIALQHAASIVVSAIRPADFAFRYGGEEFAILLVEADLELGLKIAERIRSRMEASAAALPNGRSARLTVSVGLAGFAGELDFEAFLKRADMALYEAKQAGRNRVVVAPAGGAGRGQ